MLKKHKLGVLEMIFLGSLLFFSRNAGAQSAFEAEYNTQSKSISASLNADTKKVSPFIYYSDENGKTLAIDAGISSEKINLKPFAVYIDNAPDIDRCGGLKADFNLKKSVLNLEALVGNATTSSTTNDSSFSSEHYSGTDTYDIDVTVNTETEINTANTGITGICQYSSSLSDNFSLGAFGSFAYNQIAIDLIEKTDIVERIHGNISNTPVDETTVDNETTPVSETDYQSSLSAGVTGKLSSQNFGTLFNVWYDAGKILADASAVVKLGKLSSVVRGSTYDSSINAELLIPLESDGIDSEKLLEKQEKIDNIKKFENYNNKVLEAKESQLEKSFNNNNYKNLIVLSADKKDELEAGIKYYGSSIKGGLSVSESAVSLSAGLGSFDFNVTLPYSNLEGKTISFTYTAK